MGTHPIFESDFDCLTEMAAYNRRWYILSSIIAGLGIGLIGASFGTEELVTMEFVQADSDSFTCIDSVKNERKVGLFTGSDSLCLLSGPVQYPHWPVACLGNEKYCRTIVPSELESISPPRQCECSSYSGDDKTATPTYESGLHWAIFSILLTAALVAAYGTATAFYNGITKPTQEIFGVRAVLASLLGAILLNLIGMILTIVYYYGTYKVSVECDDPSIEGECYQCGLMQTTLINNLPSVSQRYSCTDVNLGLSFYFQLIALVCFGLSIGAAFMGQRVVSSQLTRRRKLIRPRRRTSALKVQ